MSGYLDLSPDSKTQVWVSGFFQSGYPDTFVLHYPDFCESGYQVGLGIRSPVTETPVYF